MRKLTIPFILPWLLFVIPVNIYVIGDWAAVGLQWALFRYQQSLMGSSLICLGNDVNYIYMGLLAPKTLASVLIGFLAAAVLVIGLGLLLKDFQKQSPQPYKNTGLAILISGCLFLISDMIQYGPILFSKYSFCIPLGIPIFLIVGYWEYRYASDFVDAQIKPCPADAMSNSIPQNLAARIGNSEIIQELAVLVIISLFVKYIVYSLSFFAPYEVSGDDVRLYYSYASMVLGGHVPYIHFSVEYPQFFFIPILIAAIPLLIVHNLTVYSGSILVLMYSLDIATLALVYLAALRLFGKDRAFLCGVLYATAFSATFFTPLTFDIFPTFCLLLALVLFIHRYEASGYISATVGTLAKWFPCFCYPFFFLYTIKNRISLHQTMKGILASSALLIISIVPFLYLKPDLFLETYITQIGRKTDPHSIMYYADELTGALFHIQPFSGISLILLTLGEIAIIAWYWRSFNAKEISLFAALFLSIYFFMLVNKAGTPTFIVWVTPFLALFLINSYREIILFYLIQLIIYIETPLLLGIVWKKGGDGYAVGYAVFENSLPSVPFLFYTVKYAVFVLFLAYVIWRFHQECTYKNS